MLKIAAIAASIEVLCYLILVLAFMLISGHGSGVLFPLLLIIAIPIFLKNIALLMCVRFIKTYIFSVAWAFLFSLTLARLVDLKPDATEMVPKEYYIWAFLMTVFHIAQSVIYAHRLRARV